MNINYKWPFWKLTNYVMFNALKAGCKNFILQLFSFLL